MNPSSEPKQQTHEPKQKNPMNSTAKPMNPKIREENEGRNINKPKDPEKKMKPSWLKFNRLRLRGLIFVVWKRSSLFGFDLRGLGLIFVV